jgi:hypothetical protein
MLIIDLVRIFLLVKRRVLEYLVRQARRGLVKKITKRVLTRNELAIIIILSHPPVKLRYWLEVLPILRADNIRRGQEYMEH